MFKKTSGYGKEADELLGLNNTPVNKLKKIHTRRDIREIALLIAILAVLSLIALTYNFYREMDERIDCASLSQSSIKYLESVGENLPPLCDVR